MSDVPTLWYDLGVNYYHQARLSCASEEQDSQSLILEKAQQVTYYITHCTPCHLFLNVVF